jgi:hypothetical protein
VQPGANARQSAVIAYKVRNVKAPVFRTCYTVY